MSRGAVRPGDAVRTVLGISADYHDAAAALVVDGRLVAAAQEERFSRTKHDPELPVQALAWCLAHAGVEPGQLDLVAFHGKPATTYERILTSHARRGPGGYPQLLAALRSWTGRKRWPGLRIDRALHQLGHPPAPQVFVAHHLGHAASAFLASPFDSAAVLTFDGVGEWTTTSIGHGRGGEVALLEEVAYPDSLGLLYSAITAHCGFAVNDGESKLMGLATYGTPTFAAALREHLVELRPDGSFRLHREHLDLESSASMLRPSADAVLGGPARRPDAPLTRREADLAASVQVVLEEAVLAIARRAHEATGERRACLAGGVALNCVANARLLAEGPFDEVWVQPAAGDAGGAIGAALWAAHTWAGVPRTVDPADAMAGCALGPAFADDEVAAWLDVAGVAARRVGADERADLVAERLAAGDVVGWCTGRMEMGPRALGQRSILADPRRADVVRLINRRTKGREGFRPLAPAVLAERAGDLFALDRPSPHMLFTAPVLGAEADPTEPTAWDEAGLAARLAAVRSPLPGCTHVDGSARVQTVDADRHPELHDLLVAFDRRTGCPALVNTSFNVAGEPIVRTPSDALATALAAGLDLLVLGGLVVEGAELARLRAGAADPVGQPVGAA